MKQRGKDPLDLDVFFSGFWPRYRYYVFTFIVLFCIPSVLHVVGLSKIAFGLFWVLIGFAALDVLWTLPRFIRAVWYKKNKPYQGLCIVDYSLWITAILVGSVLAKLVGLF